MKHPLIGKEVRLKGVDFESDIFKVTDYYFPFVEVANLVEPTQVLEVPVNEIKEFSDEIRSGTVAEFFEYKSVT